MPLPSELTKEVITRLIAWTLVDNAESEEFDEFAELPDLDSEDDVVAIIPVTGDHVRHFTALMFDLQETPLMDVKLELAREVFPIREKMYQMSKLPTHELYSEKNKAEYGLLSSKEFKLQKMIEIVDHCLWERVFRRCLRPGEITDEAHIDLTTMDTLLGPVRRTKDEVLDKLMADASVKPTLLELCKKECEHRQLRKGETVRPEIKYDIAKAIGLKGIGTRDKFKPGNKAYQLVSKMLAELKFKRKGPVER
jgi:hypothetical protein